MDRTRISIVPFESFDEGLGSLEAVFNFRQVPDFSVLVVCYREGLATRGQANALPR